MAQELSSTFAEEVGADTGLAVTIILIAHAQIPRRSQIDSIRMASECYHNDSKSLPWGAPKAIAKTGSCRLAFRFSAGDPRNPEFFNADKDLRDFSASGRVCHWHPLPLAHMKVPEGVPDRAPAGLLMCRAGGPDRLPRAAAGGPDRLPRAALMDSLGRSCFRFFGDVHQNPEFLNADNDLRDFGASGRVCKLHPLPFAHMRAPAWGGSRR